MNTYEMAVAGFVERSDARIEYLRQVDGGTDFGGLASGNIALGPSGGFGTQAFDEGDRERYRRFQGRPYALINRAATTVAGLKIRVGRKVRGSGRRNAEPTWSKGAPDNVEPIEAHPLLDILAAPNELMVQWHLQYITVASLELTAESHWWLWNEGGQRTIWPIPSSWIKPNHKTAAGPWGAWDIQPGGRGSPITVSKDDVVYFHYPNPIRPEAVFSPTQAASRPIKAEEAMGNSQVQAFDNGIWGRTAIIAGDIAGTEEGDEGVRVEYDLDARQALTDAIRRRWTGVVNSHEPLILDALIQKIETFGPPINEMDFLDSSKLTTQQIDEIFSVNPVMMGRIEGSNRASAHEARRQYAEVKINPLALLMSQIMTRRLGPKVRRRGQPGVVVWVEPYVPDDVELQLRYAQLAAKHFAVSRKDLRALAGLPTAGWDDDVVLNPITQVVVPIEGADPALRIAASAPRLLTKAVMPTKDDLVTQWLKRHETHEATLHAAMEKFFAEQRDSVVKQLVEMFTVKADEPLNFVASQVFRPEQWSKRLREIVTPVLRAMMIESYAAEMEVAERALKQLVELPEDVLEAIDREVATIVSRPYWDDINQTTLQRLSDTLGEGMENGESLHELTTRVGDGPTVPVSDDALHGVLGSQSNTIRATLIVRSETTGAMGAGHQMAQEQLADDGLLVKKHWATIQDEHTRDTHSVLNGVSIPVRDNYSVGGFPAPYPGHHSLPVQERANCRCLSQSDHREFL